MWVPPNEVELRFHRFRQRVLLVLAAGVAVGTAVLLLLR